MRQLRDYTLGETLYQGQETRVCRAVHATSREPVVIKLPMQAPPSLRTVGRLLHEHQILSKLAAVPGVVRCRGVAQQLDSAALFLEDLGLRSLEQVLAERGRLTVDAALRVALSLSSVLESVHAAGIVHKDIKPQTIITVENRRVFAPHRLLSVGSW